ncbi:MAG TPA: DNA starvation/stationary phase protection protein [bacterium]|nr:DNA starvation/stationary phase protection protein [bacterium]
MEPNIGISSKGREAVGKLLNTLLSDEVALYVKTRNFHWNVAGPHFNDLHKFFEGQYEALDEILDDVAERARALGVPAYGSFTEFSRATRLKENPSSRPLSAPEMVRQLLADHEAVIRNLRRDHEVPAKLGDAGTDDFLVGLIEEHEKMAWMLRAMAGKG